jgi:type I restriction-modification system DNA methylase subunit
MAFNAETDFKALRMRVEALERKLETIEKTVRALPDLAAIAKLVPRLDAAEKAIALKKDAKTAEQEAAKYAATMGALAKETAKQTVLDNRLKILEAQIQTAMAMAGGKR